MLIALMGVQIRAFCALNAPVRTWIGR